MFQQLLNEFQTIKHERHDTAGGDPTGWLYQASQFFKFQSVAPEEQVDVASMHLDGIALQWHRWFTKLKGPVTWAEFSQAFLERFGPTDYENPAEALSQLKHTTTVAQYQESFEKLSHQVDGLPEEFLMACYIGGLKDEARLEVMMKKPRSLIDAMGLSRMAEEKLGLVKKQSQPVRFSTTPLPSPPTRTDSAGILGPSPTTTLALPSPPTRTDSAGILGPSPTTTLALPSPLTRRISNTEAKARHEKGLCYYCDEKYLPGTIHPQTLRMPEKIKNKEVVVLIYGGSTHNFIDQALVDRFGLIIDREITFEVIVGNREKELCPSRVKELSLVIQGFTILTDFWVLPVSACPVVLGVQWLKTLGPMEINYQKLTFRFKLAGATHTLQGLKATELQAIPANELVALQGLAYFLQIEPFGMPKPTGSVPCLAIQRLLQRYDSIFQEPRGLPPTRSQDHHIPLLPGAKPILATNRLSAKVTKCCFGVSKVNYLGHVISSSGVAVDQSKVQAVLDWRTPRNAKGVRGFLGLAGYYRKFIKNFGTIAAPLHKLVGKSAFSWDSVAETAFQQLKRALTTTPTLGLPDWSKFFIVESWSTYEKEMLAIVKAVRNWKSYLLGRPFVVKTDHISLKYLLDQRVSTPAQARWLLKLMGYDFRVDYKRGVTNIGADALSRQPEFSFLAVSHVTAGWSHLVQRNGVWFRGDVILLSPTSSLISKVLQHFHASPEGGHFGFHKTLARVKGSFWWSRIKDGVKRFIHVYHVYQRFKTESCHPARCRPKKWADWLAWAEFSYNTSVHLPSKMTPFEAVYGRPPPRVLTYVPGTPKVQAVEEFLIDRDKVLHDLRSNLLAANDRMKSKADSRRREVEFSFGDLVYLKLHPYRQSTVVVRLSAKIGPKFFGPYKFLERVGPVAYRLELPPRPLSIMSSMTQPEVVLEERVVKKGKYRPKAEILVKWQGFPREDATWETKWRFQRAYPDFLLEDKAISSEYASHGSLEQVINDTALTWTQRLKIYLGSAEGLRFLHDPKGTHQRVLHRYIKSANILLDENLNAKLADFRLSKISPTNQQHTFLVTSPAGTHGYCDPLYMEAYQLTKESDVYSFGVVLFEVLCGKTLDEIIFPDITHQLDPSSVETFVDIAYQCLQKFHEQRPTMSVVVEKPNAALELKELHDLKLQRENEQEEMLRLAAEYGYGEILKFADPTLIYKSMEELKVLLSKGSQLTAAKR
nr:protein kinase-like domain, phloem protein 2-like protein [Tanacetum cinerariifolium]